MSDVPFKRPSIRKARPVKSPPKGPVYSHDNVQAIIMRKLASKKLPKEITRWTGLREPPKPREPQIPIYVNKIATRASSPKKGTRVQTPIVMGPRPIQYVNFGPHEKTKAHVPFTAEFLHGPSENVQIAKLFESPPKMTPNPLFEIKPRKTQKKRPEIQVINVPVVAQTVRLPKGVTQGTSPTHRIRIRGKLPSGYRKDELVRIIKNNFGLPASSNMTVKELTALLGGSTSKKVPFVPYSKRTVKELDAYIKKVGVSVPKGALKAEKVQAIQDKLEMNVLAFFEKPQGSNFRSRVTMRDVFGSLSNKGWTKNNINRNAIQRLFMNRYM